MDTTSKSLALYRKYRPITWQEVSGQDQVTHTLQNAVAGGRIGHAYLFSGPRGTGKTSVARLLAKAANCLEEDLSKRPCNQCGHCRAVNEGSFLDMIEIDAASNNSVDDIRDLRDKINFTPNQGRFKVYIVDEVHMLSPSAFNALLKTLEEPPPHAIFILATTEIHKIPATILSRCQQHEFRRASLDVIVAQLKAIAEKEGISADEAALALIARQATGSFRDAISLLDQLASTGEHISPELVHTVLGTATSSHVLALVDAILARDQAAGLEHLHASLDAGSDPRQLARQVVDYLRALLLIRMGNADQVDLPGEALKQARMHAEAFQTGQVLAILKEFNTVAADTRSGWHPALGLELALAGVMNPAEQPVVQPVPQVPATEVASQVPTKVVAKKTLDSNPVTQPVQLADEPLASNTGMGEHVDQALSPEALQLRNAWNVIKTDLGAISKVVQTGFNSSKYFELKGDVLTLVYPSDVALQKSVTREMFDMVHKVILERTKLDLQVKCKFISKDGSISTEVDPESMLAAGLNLGGRLKKIKEE